ncbi:unnamed protein product, partial [Lasius platythorax]
ITDTEAGV